MMGLMATIDEHRPKYTLESSLIGTNPGKMLYNEYESQVSAQIEILLVRLGLNKNINTNLDQYSLQIFCFRNNNHDNSYKLR